MDMRDDAMEYQCTVRLFVLLLSLLSLLLMMIITMLMPQCSAMSST
jgi:hypothetical protein